MEYLIYIYLIGCILFTILIKMNKKNSKTISKNKIIFLSISWPIFLSFFLFYFLKRK